MDLSILVVVCFMIIIITFGTIFSVQYFRYKGEEFTNIDMLLSAAVAAGISIVIIILVLSFLELFFWMYKKSIRSRNSFFIILAYFILLLFINIDGSYFLALTPISIVVANFFVYSKRKRLTEILFLLFLLASVYYRISI